MTKTLSSQSKNPPNHAKEKIIEEAIIESSKAQKAHNLAPSDTPKPYSSGKLITCLQESPFTYTLSLIAGKYKMSILYCLYRHEIVRYNELKRLLENVSFKTLTQALRELEDDNLIIRTQYEQIPPRVEYSLSPRGASLIPILHEMCEWGKANKPQD